jgi:hypothetical protein
MAGLIIGGFRFIRFAKIKLFSRAEHSPAYRRVGFADSCFAKNKLSARTAELPRTAKFALREFRKK